MVINEQFVAQLEFEERTLTSSLYDWGSRNLIWDLFLSLMRTYLRVACGDRMLRKEYW